MIFSALLSFLGGSAFRMIWGEISNFVNKRQDHQHEIQRLTLQKELDAAAHDREVTIISLQHQLGIRTIEAQREAEVEQEEARAFTEAMKDAFRPTGVWWVDLWNGVIRPAAATVVLVLWIVKLWSQGGKMDAFDMELTCAVLGFFFADRSLGKRGK
jgi:hypothetical protein